MRRLDKTMLRKMLRKMGNGEMVLYAIVQAYSVLLVYGGLFQQLEELIVPGSEPETFR